MKKLFLLSVLLLYLNPLCAQTFRSESWPNGKPRYEGNWQENVPVGKHKWWHENGEKSIEINYSDTGTPLKIFTWNEKGEIMDDMDFVYEENLGSEIRQIEWLGDLHGFSFYPLAPRANCSKKPGDGSKVGIKYTGCLVDGSVFDSNQKGKKLLRFTVGENEVVEGLDRVIRQFCPGDEMWVRIPAVLGYGNKFVGQIPPGSELYFKVKLVELE